MPSVRNGDGIARLAGASLMERLISDEVSPPAVSILYEGGSETIEVAEGVETSVASAQVVSAVLDVGHASSAEKSAQGLGSRDTHRLGSKGVKRKAVNSADPGGDRLLTQIRPPVVGRSGGDRDSAKASDRSQKRKRLDSESKAERSATANEGGQRAQSIRLKESGKASDRFGRERESKDEWCRRVEDGSSDVKRNGEGIIGQTHSIHEERFQASDRDVESVHVQSGSFSEVIEIRREELVGSGLTEVRKERGLVTIRSVIGSIGAGCEGITDDKFTEEHHTNVDKLALETTSAHGDGSRREVREKEKKEDWKRGRLDALRTEEQPVIRKPQPKRLRDEPKGETDYQEDVAQAERDHAIKRGDEFGVKRSESREGRKDPRDVKEGRADFRDSRPELRGNWNEARDVRINSRDRIEGRDIKCDIVDSRIEGRDNGSGSKDCRPGLRDTRTGGKESRVEVRDKRATARDNRPELKEGRSEMKEFGVYPREGRSELRDGRSEARDSRGELMDNKKGAGSRVYSRETRPEVRDSNINLRVNRTDCKDQRTELRDGRMEVKERAGWRESSLEKKDTRADPKDSRHDVRVRNQGSCEELKNTNEKRRWNTSLVGPRDGVEHEVKYDEERRRGREGGDSKDLGSSGRGNLLTSHGEELCVMHRDGRNSERPYVRCTDRGRGQTDEALYGRDGHLTENGDHQGGRGPPTRVERVKGPSYGSQEAQQGREATEGVPRDPPYDGRKIESEYNMVKDQGRAMKNLNKEKGFTRRSRTVDEGRLSPDKIAPEHEPRVADERCSDIGDVEVVVTYESGNKPRDNEATSGRISSKSEKETLKLEEKGESVDYLDDRKGAKNTRKCDGEKRLARSGVSSQKESTSVKAEKRGGKNELKPSSHSKEAGHQHHDSHARRETGDRRKAGNDLHNGASVAHRIEGGNQRALKSEVRMNSQKEEACQEAPKDFGDCRKVAEGEPWGMSGKIKAVCQGQEHVVAAEKWEDGEKVEGVNGKKTCSRADKLEVKEDRVKDQAFNYKKSEEAVDHIYNEYHNKDIGREPRGEREDRVTREPSSSEKGRGIRRESTRKGETDDRRENAKKECTKVEKSDSKSHKGLDGERRDSAWEKPVSRSHLKVLSKGDHSKDSGKLTLHDSKKQTHRERSRSPPANAHKRRSPSHIKDSSRSLSPRHHNSREPGEWDKIERDRTPLPAFFDSRYRRFGGGTSGLGGYSPRRRRSDAAIKTPSPPPRSPERRKPRAWDLAPPGIDNTVVAAMAAAHAAQQAVALSSVSPLVSMNAHTSVSGPSGVAAPAPLPGVPSMIPSMLQQVNPAVTAVTLTQATRPLRRLYVGNVPSTVSDGELLEFMNAAMLSANANHLPGTKPCINCSVNVEKAYAFAEFITPEDATAALAFDGVTLHGTTLKIRRPKDFVPPANGGTEIAQPNIDMVSSVVVDSPRKVFVGGISSSLTSDKVKEIVTAFGQLKAYHWEVDSQKRPPQAFAFLEYMDPVVTLRACAGLNGMRLGNTILTVVQATPTATHEDMSAENPFYGIPEQAKPLLETPTRILELCNLVTEEELLAMSEEEIQEIVDDILLECMRFGSVKSMHIVRPTSSEDLTGDISDLIQATVIHTNGKTEEAVSDREIMPGLISDRQVAVGSDMEPAMEVADNSTAAEIRSVDSLNAQRSESTYGPSIAGVEVGTPKHCQVGLGNTSPIKMDHPREQIIDSSRVETVGTNEGDGDNSGGKDGPAKVDGEQSIYEQLSCTLMFPGDITGNPRSLYEAKRRPGCVEDNCMHGWLLSVLLNHRSAFCSAGSGDMKGEKEGPGTAEGETLHLGRVYVEFSRDETACQAAHTLHGRVYGDHKVVACYFPVRLYQKKFRKGLVARTYEEKQALALAVQGHLTAHIKD